MVPLAHGPLAPGHGAGSGARQRSGQDPKNHMIISVLAPARRDGGRDEAARPLEVGCRRDAPAWVTQHLASGASAGVRRRASSDEAMGRRGHAPGAAGGALAEALPGGRRVASTLWAVAKTCRGLLTVFVSLYWSRLSARQRPRCCSTRERWPARSRQWPTRAHGGEACVTLFRDS